MGKVELESGSRGSGRETGASMQIWRVLKAEVREGHALSEVYFTAQMVLNRLKN